MEKIFIKKIKPIHLTCQSGLSNSEVKSVLSGIHETLELTRAQNIEVINLGVWKGKDYLNKDGSLKPYQGSEWYIQKGKEASRNRNQLNADEMYLHLCIEPSINEKNYFNVFALHSDIYSKELNFIIGLAGAGLASIISTYRFKGLESQLRYECIKTETMHEIGHLFGLIPKERTKDVEYSLGRHCKNKCVMRQGVNVPYDWINITKDRLTFRAFCNECEEDLIKYFKS